MTAQKFDCGAFDPNDMAAFINSRQADGYPVRLPPLNERGFVRWTYVVNARVSENELVAETIDKEGKAT